MALNFALYVIPPDGCFWTRPELVGCTAEDIDANNRGALAGERKEVISVQLRLACNALATRDPEGNC